MIAVSDDASNSYPRCDYDQKKERETGEKRLPPVMIDNGRNIIERNER